MSPKGKKGKNSITPHLRPVARPRSPTPPESPPPRSLPPGTMDVTSLRNELLSALPLDVAAMFKAELREALAETLSSIKTELLAFKTELSSSLSAVRQDVASLKSTVAEVELSLSTCTDDIVALRAKVEHLTQEAKMEDKCDDLESRSRRQNIRIIGIPEDDPNAANVSKLLMEAFSLGKEPLIDRSHRALAPKPAPGAAPLSPLSQGCTTILTATRSSERRESYNGLLCTTCPSPCSRTIPPRRPGLAQPSPRFGTSYEASMESGLASSFLHDFTSPMQVYSATSLPQRRLRHLLKH